MAKEGLRSAMSFLLAFSSRIRLRTTALPMSMSCWRMPKRRWNSAKISP